METKKVKVFIYEDGKKLYGTIQKTENGFYTILWDDGETTREVIAEFNPAGWVQ